MAAEKSSDEAILENMDLYLLWNKSDHDEEKKESNVPTCIAGDVHTDGDMETADMTLDIHGEVTKHTHGDLMMDMEKHLIMAGEERLDKTDFHLESEKSVTKEIHDDMMNLTHSSVGKHSEVDMKLTVDGDAHDEPTERHLNIGDNIEATLKVSKDENIKVHVEEDPTGKTEGCIEASITVNNSEKTNTNISMHMEWHKKSSSNNDNIEASFKVNQTGMPATERKHDDRSNNIEATLKVNKGVAHEEDGVIDTEQTEHHVHSRPDHLHSRPDHLHSRPDPLHSQPHHVHSHPDHAHADIKSEDSFSDSSLEGKFDPCLKEYVDINIKKEKKRKKKKSPKTQNIDNYLDMCKHGYVDKNRVKKIKIIQYKIKRKNDTSDLDKECNLSASIEKIIEADLAMRVGENNEENGVCIHKVRTDIPKKIETEKDIPIDVEYNNRLNTRHKQEIETEGKMPTRDHTYTETTIQKRIQTKTIVVYEEPIEDHDDILQNADQHALHGKEDACSEGETEVDGHVNLECSHGQSTEFVNISMENIGADIENASVGGEHVVEEIAGCGKDHADETSHHDGITLEIKNEQSVESHKEESIELEHVHQNELHNIDMYENEANTELGIDGDSADALVEGLVDAFVHVYLESTKDMISLGDSVEVFERYMDRHIEGYNEEDCLYKAKEEEDFKVSVEGSIDVEHEIQIDINSAVCVEGTIESEEEMCHVDANKEKMSQGSCEFLNISMENVVLEESVENVKDVIEHIEHIEESIEESVEMQKYDIEEFDVSCDTDICLEAAIEEEDLKVSVERQVEVQHVIQIDSAFSIERTTESDKVTCHVDAVNEKMIQASSEFLNISMENVVLEESVESVKDVIEHIEHIEESVEVHAHAIAEDYVSLEKDVCIHEAKEEEDFKVSVGESIEIEHEFQIDQIDSAISIEGTTESDELTCHVDAINEKMIQASSEFLNISMENVLLEESVESVKDIIEHIEESVEVNAHDIEGFSIHETVYECSVEDLDSDGYGVGVISDRMTGEIHLETSTERHTDEFLNISLDKIIEEDTKFLEESHIDLYVDEDMIEPTIIEDVKSSRMDMIWDSNIERHVEEVEIDITVNNLKETGIEKSLEMKSDFLTHDHVEEEVSVINSINTTGNSNDLTNSEMKLDDHLERRSSDFVDISSNHDEMEGCLLMRDMMTDVRNREYMMMRSDEHHHQNSLEYVDVTLMREVSVEGEIDIAPRLEKLASSSYIEHTELEHLVHLTNHGIDICSEEFLNLSVDNITTEEVLESDDDLASEAASVISCVDGEGLEESIPYEVVVEEAHAEEVVENIAIHDLHTSPLAVSWKTEETHHESHVHVHAHAHEKHVKEDVVFIEVHANTMETAVGYTIDVGHSIEDSVGSSMTLITDMDIARGLELSEDMTSLEYDHHHDSSEHMDSYLELDVSSELKHSHEQSSDQFINIDMERQLSVEHSAEEVCDEYVVEACIEEELKSSHATIDFEHTELNVELEQAPCVDEYVAKHVVNVERHIDSEHIKKTKHLNITRYSIEIERSMEESIDTDLEGSSIEHIEHETEISVDHLHHLDSIRSAEQSEMTAEVETSAELEHDPSTDQFINLSLKIHEEVCTFDSPDTTREEHLQVTEEDSIEEICGDEDLNINVHKTWTIDIVRQQDAKVESDRVEVKPRTELVDKNIINVERHADLTQHKEEIGVRLNITRYNIDLERSIEDSSESSIGGSIEEHIGGSTEVHIVRSLEESDIEHIDLSVQEHIHDIEEHVETVSLETVSLVQAPHHEIETDIHEDSIHCYEQSSDQFIDIDVEEIIVEHCTDIMTANEGEASEIESMLSSIEHLELHESEEALIGIHRDIIHSTESIVHERVTASTEIVRLHSVEPCELQVVEDSAVNIGITVEDVIVRHVEPKYNLEDKHFVNVERCASLSTHAEMEAQLSVDSSIDSSIDDDEDVIEPCTVEDLNASLTTSWRIDLAYDETTESVHYETSYSGCMAVKSPEYVDEFYDQNIVQVERYADMREINERQAEHLCICRQSINMESNMESIVEDSEEHVVHHDSYGDYHSEASEDFIEVNVVAEHDVEVDVTAYTENYVHRHVEVEADTEINIHTHLGHDVEVTVDVETIPYTEDIHEKNVVCVERYASHNAHMRVESEINTCVEAHIETSLEESVKKHLQGSIEKHMPKCIVVVADGNKEDIVGLRDLSCDAGLRENLKHTLYKSINEYLNISMENIFENVDHDAEVCADVDVDVDVHHDIHVHHEEHAVMHRSFSEDLEKSMHDKHSNGYVIILVKREAAGGEEVTCSTEREHHIDEATEHELPQEHDIRGTEIVRRIEGHIKGMEICVGENAEEHLQHLGGEHLKHLGGEVIVVNVGKSTVEEKDHHLYHAEEIIEEHIIEEHIEDVEAYRDDISIESSFAEESGEFNVRKLSDEHEHVHADAHVDVHMEKHTHHHDQHTHHSDLHYAVYEYVEEFLRSNEMHVMDRDEMRVHESRDAYVVGYVVVNAHKTDEPHSLHVSYTELGENESERSFGSSCNLAAYSDDDDEPGYPIMFKQEKVPEDTREKFNHYTTDISLQSEPVKHAYWRTRKDVYIQHGHTYIVIHGFYE